MGKYVKIWHYLGFNHVKDQSNLGRFGRKLLQVGCKYFSLFYFKFLFQVSFSYLVGIINRVMLGFKINVFLL